MSKAIILNSDNFQKEVKESNIPVVVDFWAPWCGPCRALAPAIEALADEYSGRVKFCKLDTETARDLAIQYRVMSIPCVIAFKNGQEIDRVLGNLPNKIKAMADNLL